MCKYCLIEFKALKVTWQWKVFLDAYPHSSRSNWLKSTPVTHNWINGQLPKRNKKSRPKFFMIIHFPKKKRNFLCGDSRQSSERWSLPVCGLCLIDKWFKWIILFVWLVFYTTTESGTSEPQQLSFLFPLITFFFLPFTLSFPTTQPGWYHGRADVRSLPVWYWVALVSKCSLLTAVSRAGNMQINRAEG